MKRLLLSAYTSLMVVGITTTAMRLVEDRSPVTHHFLLQLLWVGVAVDNLFVIMLQPALNKQSRNDAETDLDSNDVIKWHILYRIWIQQQPYERYLTNDIDREEA